MTEARRARGRLLLGPMMSRTPFAVLTVMLCACGAGGDDSTSTGASSPSGDSSENGNGSTPGGAPSLGSGGGTAAPPETEVESLYQTPVATAHYVWSANPTSGRVAYIDPSSLVVKTVEAGNGPTYLAAVPGTSDDVALVINVLSDDATLFRVNDHGLTSPSVHVAHGVNTWAVSHDAHWAVAWADARRVPNADKTQGFQDITVIDLTASPPAATDLAVGYRPVSIAFAEGQNRAFAVTEDGISIVDLAASGGPTVVKNVVVSDAPSTERDVSITPDGALALVRDGTATIGIVDLATSERKPLTLSGPVTDLDLSDSGDRAVAVVRATSSVAVLPIPAIASDQSKYLDVKIGSETIGSVSLTANGARALLYTNAVPVERMTVLKLDSIDPSAQADYRVIQLHAPVLSVLPSLDGRHAIVTHSAGSGDAGALAGAAGAFSVVPIADELPAKIVSTEAPPTAIAIADSGERALVAVRSDTSQTFGAYLVAMPSLVVTAVPLASAPSAVGVVEGAGRGFIAQDHPDGRVTFVDFASGTSHTLTGFELSARVVTGDQQ